MKSLSCLIFTLIVASAVAVAPELKEKVFAAISECKKSYNVEQGLIEKVINHMAVPETDDGKCLAACVLKTIGLIENGKYQWEKSLAMNKLKYDKEEDVAKADEVIKKCGPAVPETLTNDCELALEITKCVTKEAKEIGLPPPFAQ